MNKKLLLIALIATAVGIPISRAYAGNACYNDNQCNFNEICMDGVCQWDGNGDGGSLPPIGDQPGYPPYPPYPPHERAELADGSFIITHTITRQWSSEIRYTNDYNHYGVLQIYSIANDPCLGEVNVGFRDGHVENFPINICRKHDSEVYLTSIRLWRPGQIEFIRTTAKHMREKNSDVAFRFVGSYR